MLQRLVEREVADGPLPGAVAAFDDPSGLEVAVAGERAAGVPMTRDTVFRIASVGKPILAAAALVHVERGTVGLDDPVARWLPELAEPRVLRDPSGPLDDTVPAVRPITVRHLLSLTGGLGMISDFSAPLMAVLFGDPTRGRPTRWAPRRPTSGSPAPRGSRSRISRGRGGPTTPAPTSSACCSPVPPAARSGRCSTMPSSRRWACPTPPSASRRQCVRGSATPS